MAEPDYSKSWYQRSGGKLPFSEALANHLRNELGPNASHRYDAYHEVFNKLRDQYANKYGDWEDWPESEYLKFKAEDASFRPMFVRPHEQKLFEQLESLEATNPMWEPETTERTLRQQYPDLVARMERGQVQPIEEPRAPVMQPKPPVMPPVRKAEPVPPPLKSPVQKPAQVTPPRQRVPTENEQKIMNLTSQLEKEGYFKPPTQQDLAKERLRNMMYERDKALRARPVLPVSLPEAVNPTGE